MIREKAAFDGKLTREWREENNSNNFSDLEDYKIGENHHTKSLIAKELPPNWKQVNFEDVLDIISGKNQKYVEDENGMYPIYGSGGVIGKANEYLCEAGTTIVGRKGTINTPIYVNEKFWNIDTAFGLSPSKILYSKYLFYFCQGFNFKTLDKSTTIPSLAKRDLLKIKLQLAPLPEQRSIVAKIEELFSELDSGIANLQKAKEQLKVYRQAVLKAAFEGELTREWRKENRYSMEKDLENYKRAKEIAIKEKLIPKANYFPKFDEKDLIYKTPKNWIILPWKSVVSNNKYAMKRGPFGSTLKKEFFVSDGIPVYEQANAINNNAYEHRYFITEEKFKELESFSVTAGEMIISCSGTLGRISLLPDDARTGVINQALLKIDIDETIIKKDYFLLLFRSESFQRLLYKKSIGTAMRNMVGMKDLKEIPIHLPSIEEQNKIVQEIESRLSVCEHIEATIEEALEKSEALRMSVLKKAFEGKLLSKEEIEACKKESDWEPAANLLKRIKEDKKGAKSNG